VDPLQATLSGSLLAGHERGRPLLLSSAGGGLLLSEIDGGFPIAWGSALDSLLPVLRRLIGETVLIADLPGLAPALEEEELRVLNPVQAASLSHAMDDAGQAWQALAVERPGVPLASVPDLERALTMAAAFSLSTLAWTLWRDREPTGPALALDRFGDLTARVSFHADAVRILLPMGRRRLDLFSHGLLGPVRDAAWLNGRVIEFGGA